MTNDCPSFASLTDDQLLTHVKALAANERQITATLIAALTELDARRLYLRDGYPSLFAYCTQALQLSEDAAYNRIRAARAAAKWPVVLDMLANGSITVTALRLLSDVLTHANHADLLRAASGKTKRQVEAIVAALDPRPGVAASIGQVSDDCYSIQFTISQATHDRLRRVQDLMRHTNPTGDPAVIFDRALTLLLQQIEKAKLGQATRARKQQRATRPGSRHIPSAVKREVWAGDGRQCAFVGAAGRCSETGFLEYHHVVPFADGGETTTANIQLRCRAHNAYEADEWFGAAIVRERHSDGANWFGSE